MDILNNADIDSCYPFNGSKCFNFSSNLTESNKRRLASIVNIPLFKIGSFSVQLYFE
ncbi:MAG: hypothetical protein ACI9RU_002942 [Litorivivens sp.]|jgi:hypothetical protein